jgi:hypothetical protein
VGERLQTAPARLVIRSGMDDEQDARKYARREEFQ